MLEFLENSLGDNKWMVGDNFTVADIAIASQFSAMDYSGYPIDPLLCPKLGHYLTNVMNRKSYQKSLNG